MDERPERATDFTQAAATFLGKDEEAFTDTERLVLQRSLLKKALSKDVAADLEVAATLGERMADRVAALGGSWPFLAGFALFLFVWIGANTIARGAAPDPFPYIFLNLMLSMLAAVQAPIIMMSQNRQAAKDRSMSAHDYECNLKAELEIMALHDKIDQLRGDELRSLLMKQQEQIELITRLVKRQGASS